MIPCPGPCNREYRRCPDDVEPRPGQPVWCGGCAAAVAEALGEIPALLDVIADEALHRTAPPGEKVSGGSGSALPGESQRVVEDNIAGGLVEIEDDVRRLRPGFSPRPRRRWRPGLDVTVSFLYGQLGWLLDQHPNTADPYGSPGATILRWRWQALRAARADEHVDHLPAACPTCDLLALVRYDGSESVHCRCCGRVMTRDDYGLLARIYAHELAGAGA